MYIPIIYKIPKTKQEWKNASIIAGAVCVILACVMSYMIIKDYGRDIQLYSAYGYSPTEMADSGDFYEFNQAAVLGYYATTEYDSSPTSYHFMIAYFSDEEDDNAYLANITLSQNDGEIFDKMLAYSKSDNDDFQYISFCAEADPAKNLDKDIYDYYREAADECVEGFENVQDSDLRLFYRFDEPDQLGTYLEEKQSSDNFGLVMAGVLMLAGIVFILLGAVKRGPTKKQLEKARQQLQAEGAYNTPSYAQPETEDDRFSYIHSDEYFQRPSEDYNYNNENNE